MTRTDELLQNFADKWCLKVIECMKDDDYIMHAPDECLADLHSLLNKLMPSEEEVKNGSVKENPQLDHIINSLSDKREVWIAGAEWVLNYIKEESK